MNIIEFDVKGVGHFKARQQPTILEETHIDNKTDDMLDGKYYELQSRAISLADKDRETADQVFLKIRVIQVIATLETLLIEMPDTVKLREITDYSALFAIWNEYKKKIKDSESEKKK